jgi:tetratricopeptide (TPR) repeat protein
MDQMQPQGPIQTPVEEQIKLGQELMNQGKIELALQHFEEATKLAEDRSQEKADAFYQLGNAFRFLGRFDEAIDSYGNAIANNSNDVEAYLRRGIVWFYKGEYDIAWNDFDDAASIVRMRDEPYPEFWKGLAKAKQGAWLDAVNSYTESLLRDRKFALAYTNRGLAYLQLDEPEKAVLDFNQAIRNDHHNPVHYYRRGIAQTRMGRIPDAIESYNHALRINPNYGDAAKNRQLLEGRAGR